MVNSALDNSAKKEENMVNYFDNVCSKSPSTIADINLWTGRWNFLRLILDEKCLYLKSTSIFERACEYNMNNIFL
jgi:hypothetical protein